MCARSLKLSNSQHHLTGSCLGCLHAKPHTEWHGSLHRCPLCKDGKKKNFLWYLHFTSKYPPLKHTLTLTHTLWANVRETDGADRPPGYGGIYTERPRSTTYLDNSLPHNLNWTCFQWRIWEYTPLALPSHTHKHTQLVLCLSSPTSTSYHRILDGFAYALSHTACLGVYLSSVITTACKLKHSPLPDSVVFSLTLYSS